MLPFSQMAYENIQERNKKEENQIGFSKTVRQFPDRNQRIQDAVQGNLFVACQPENQRDHNPVEHKLQQKFQEFAKGNGFLAHKPAAEKDKAVNSDLAPGAPKQKIKRMGSGRIGKNRAVHSRNTGIHHIVMSNDEQHQQNAEKFEIGTSLFLFCHRSSSKLFLILCPQTPINQCVISITFKLYISAISGSLRQPAELQ